METFEARLASFGAPAATGRKRASTTRGGKGGKWNLKSPSAEDLARAGFYYAPTGLDSDNVTCFCCERNLDGWCEGDDPFAEHLHYSKDCGWAIISAMENGSKELLNEDPMSERMLEVRRQTFIDQWPHEKKRGWTCKVQKMIEGGWFFSPSPEGEDQTGCVYCKKSLWGWEPKDNPYDEHKKRSPDCPFFHYSKAVPATKGRKTRASKTARASVDTDATAVDGPTVPRYTLEDTQTSLMTTDMSIATTTKAKKGGRPKKAPAKNKRAKVPAETLEEATDVDEPVPAPVTRATRGKKRGSDQMEDSVQILQPPQKKQATRGRAASASKRGESSVVDATMEDSELPAVVSKKAVKGGKKRGSSTTRKPSARIASAQSVASQIPQAIPEDDEIDAQLAADLARFESEDEGSDNWKVLGTDDSVLSQLHAPRMTRSSNIKINNNSVIEDRSNDLIEEQLVEGLPSTPDLIEEQLTGGRLSTPATPPSTRNVAGLETSYPWTPADIDYILHGTPAPNKENIDPKNNLTSVEKKMTLQKWIMWNAKVKEDQLKAECERMVGKFESEGIRALKTLEGLVCSD